MAAITLQVLRSELQLVTDDLKHEMTQLGKNLQDHMATLQFVAGTNHCESPVSNTSLGDHDSHVSVVPQVHNSLAKMKEDVRQTRKQEQARQQRRIRSVSRHSTIEHAVDMHPSVPSSSETVQFLIPRRDATSDGGDSCREFVTMENIQKADHDVTGSAPLDEMHEHILHHAISIDPFSDTSDEDEELLRHSRYSSVYAWWYMFHRVINSGMFVEATSFAIILNAICVGLEAQYMATRWTLHLPATITFIEIFFCVFFSIEVSLRFCLVGCKDFFCSDRGYGWQWNWFDLCATGLQVASVSGGQFKFFKVIRLVRLLRIVRMARVLKRVSQLRMLMASIKDAMKSLGWVMLLLMTMIYTFAVFLTLEVTKLKVEHSALFEELEEKDLSGAEKRSREQILEWFGSVDKSMLSLYAATAEGIHWEELMEPLAAHISPWMRLVFFCFSAVALIAAMNAITAVFVESAVHSAEEDRKHAISRQMKKMFRRADGDASGDITYEEFEEQVESPEVTAALQEIDVDPEDARELFRLLDMDASGAIDIDELVQGSYRLMGHAKAIDLATLMNEFKHVTAQQQKHVIFVEDCLRKLVASPLVNSFEMTDSLMSRAE